MGDPDRSLNVLEAFRHNAREADAKFASDVRTALRRLNDEMIYEDVLLDPLDEEVLRRLEQLVVNLLIAYKAHYLQLSLETADLACKSGYDLARLLTQCLDQKS